MTANTGNHLKGIGPALAILGISAAVTLWSSASPAEDARVVALVYPPGTTLEDAYARATRNGGRAVRSGITSNILVVSYEDARIWRDDPGLGAWLVLDPEALGGCLT